MPRIAALAATAIAIVLVACGQKRDRPEGSGGLLTPFGASAGGAGGCAAACQKLLGCAGVAGGAEQARCVASCRPDDPDLAAIARMSCAEILRAMGGGGGGEVAFPAGGLGEPGEPGAGAGEPGAAGGCTADCTGCVGDGESCWAAAGGSHGIPCDSCCCAPGGPAPVWR